MDMAYIRAFDFAS